MQRVKNFSVPLPKRLKLRISKKLLDWAETFPKFQGGYIYQLQLHREYQRKESDSTYQRTRPPEGTELHLLGIRMVELFQYEDFERVMAGLLHLFPGLSGNSHDEPFRVYFQQLGETITGGGWRNLGCLYRNKKPYIGSDINYQLAKLPPEVTYIQVALQKFLPSTLVISIDVNLDQNASKQLKTLQEGKYLPETSVDTVYPHLGFLGMSQNTSEIVMEREILLWLERIREGIEVCIRPFLSGFFTKQATGRARLPAIEIYGLKGHLKNHSDLISWANEAWHWWHSLGFSFYLSLYGNEKVLFNWPDHRDEAASSAYRVIVLWESYISSKNLQPYGGDEENAIKYPISYFLNEFLTPFAALAYLRTSVRQIERLRGSIFGSMRRSRFSSGNLSKKIRLYTELQQETMALDRLTLEFSQKEKYLLKRMMDEAKDMDYIQLHSGTHNPEGNLPEALLSSIHYLQKLLQEHITFIDKSLSTYIEFLNIDAILRLQWITLTLTVVAVIASLIGLAAGWENIKSFLKLLPFLSMK